LRSNRRVGWVKNICQWVGGRKSFAQWKINQLPPLKIL
jgi:hypothetical protein